MKNWKQVLSSFLALCVSVFYFSLSTDAQSFKAKARKDVSSIKIGEQFKLILEAEAPMGYKFSFPQLPDTITKLEIIDRSKIDTAVLEDKKLYSYTQTLTVTCFDSGYYPIPPLTFSYQQPGDTTMRFAETEAMLVTVQSVAVDTTQNIRDIKMPMKASITLAELLPYILGAFGAVVLVTLIIYFAKKRKPAEVKKHTVAVPKRPPYEIALEELKKLEGERLWQQGLVKQYHSRLSDIIRTYIELRFGIIAMEMTTGEIMQAVRNMNFDSSVAEKLSHLLTLADFVKFAKMQPLPGENEMCMQHAYEFLNMTREIKKEVPESTAQTAAA